VLQLHFNFAFLILFDICYLFRSRVTLGAPPHMLQNEHVVLLHCVLFALGSANKERTVSEIVWDFSAHRM
jgi:hypothetical protein